MAGRILVVEDTPELRAMICSVLARDGHSVETAADGVTGLARASSREFDALVLDIGLPGIDGLELLEQLRAHGSRVPILLLTSRSAVADRVAGLDAGADDYLAKPFAPQELNARVRALLRRRALERPRAEMICGPLRVEPGTLRVWINDEEKRLTRREYELLLLLMRRAGEVLSRDDLSVGLWGRPHDPSSNTIDVHVRNLRQKLGRGARGSIKTVRGVGYKLAVTTGARG